jgi:gamma-glutamylcyclotransferase (GGCT)/AIG2-like uncharacterized protein YtfP
MRNLFAYGTLMCEDIMKRVSGVSRPAFPAILKQYRRHCIKGEHYPGIQQNHLCHVKGVIYQDLPESAWLRLDRFEGDMYRRVQLDIQLDDGSIAGADTYIVRDEFLGLLQDKDWDYELFLVKGKQLFLQGYSGYDAID